MHVVTFDKSLLDQAASLLSAVHGPVPEHGARPAVHDRGVARERIQGWFGRGPAVAALVNGQLAGYLAASVPAVPGPGEARIRLPQHAAGEPDRRALYRRLYAALAGQLTALGCFTHTVTVTGHDRDLLDTWFELGFGIDQIRGVRALEPLPAAGGFRVRAATPADLPALLELTAKLTRYHAEPPMLRPALVDLGQLRDNFRSAMDRPDSHVLVVEGDRAVVGLLQLDPDQDYGNTTRIGIAAVDAGHRHRGAGTALLAGALEAGSRSGFQTCSVEWTSANLTGDRFWRGRGFVPVQYKLTRIIDSRLAWASPELDYAYFTPPE